MLNMWRGRMRMECKLLGFRAQVSEFDQEGWTACERHIAVRSRTIMVITKIMDQSLIQAVVSDHPSLSPAMQLDHE
jgi:hypothetical protein